MVSVYRGGTNSGDGDGGEVGADARESRTGIELHCDISLGTPLLCCITVVSSALIWSSKDLRELQQG